MRLLRHPGSQLTIFLIISLLINLTDVDGSGASTKDMEKEKKKKSKSRVVATVPGDIILGGLFPVHSSGAVKCMSLNPERGIQRLEAMLFTLDEINNNSAILPGLRLGANLRDTCSLGNHALEQSLDFVKTTVDDVMSEPKEQDRGACQCVCPCAPGGVPYYASGAQKMSGATMAHPTSWSQDIVRGVVGGSYTTVSILVANLYRLFKLPQISYASTSAVLSDKRTYPLFARTVPSDVEQARVMAALVAAYNWTYVSTVRSAGDYGDSGMDAFWKEADKRDVCIAAREVVRGSSTSSDLDEVVRVLRYGFSKARVVVLFTRMDHTKLLLDAVRRANCTDHFVFIGSDGWGRENIPVMNNSRVANGALTIEILATEIEKFSTYYKNLRWDNTRNPWFAKYWGSLFGCTYDNTTQQDISHCETTKNKRLGDKLPEPFKQEAKIQFVYDAVYALAHGLHHLQQKLCPFDPDPAKWDKNECIRKLLAYPGDEFYKIIISTTFKDNYNNLVAFDENGDGVGQYLIYNYARDLYSGEYQYRLVGDYKHSKLSMRYRPIWPGGQSKLVPSSQCSEECPFGSVRKYSKKQQCCWTCEECQPNAIILNLTHCQMCENQYWPTPDRKKCELLELHYIKIGSWFAIFPMVLNFIGIIATIGVIVTLALYSETPIVRATGRELTYLLLSGCLLCYLSSLILLVPPNPVACAIQRVGINLGFAIMYASLLTKTNRLARIFDAAKRTTKRPAFISPRSQLAIAGGLIGLQFALSAIWLGFDPPSTRVDPLQSNFLVLRCAIKDSSMVTSLAYIMLLIVVCTIYAVKTRSIPENFNESRFIGFAMYTTCIIWLAFVPIYFATMNNFEIQISTLSVSVSLSATVTLVCLFAPKVYIIYFHPEKNIRKLTMNSGPGGKSRYATCKSPQESYAPQSSSMATDFVVTNAMVTQSTQPSSTLKATSESHDSRIEQVDDMMEASKRPFLTPPKEPATMNVLIPRRDSKDFAEPIVVAQYQLVPNSPLEGDVTLGLANPPALISPMPLLLDNLAVGVASVPACLCEEEEIRDNASLEGTDISDVAFGNERCRSSRPTPSELSINAPDCREDDTNSANFYVYHNQASQFFDSPPSVQNGRVSSGTDSIGELWQQVKPLGVVEGRIRPGTVPDQNPKYFPQEKMPYNIVSVASKRLNEEKISSV